MCMMNVVNPTVLIMGTNLINLIYKKSSDKETTIKDLKNLVNNKIKLLNDVIIGQKKLNPSIDSLVDICNSLTARIDSQAICMERS